MLVSTVREEGHELLNSLRGTLANDGFMSTMKSYTDAPGGEVWAMTPCSHIPISKYVLMRRGKMWVWYRAPVRKASDDQKRMLGGASAAVCVWARAHNVRSTSIDKFGINVPPLAEVQ